LDQEREIEPRGAAAMGSQENRQVLETTSWAVVAADQAHVREAIGSVRWERRGLLQRLARVERRLPLEGHVEARDGEA
jgi:hypothetical protein